MSATWQILAGDCRELLRTLPERSVQTCITSPPYFGLRDYGTGEWEGGDSACDHLAPPGGGTNATGLMRDGRSEDTRQGGAERVVADRRQQYREICRCGATRTDRQIGLEPTPDEFVQALVAVFREVKRVLRDDGTVWLNLGDSYAGGGRGGHDGGNIVGTAPQGVGNSYPRSFNGCKPKDLLMIPAQVALALRADGWYLRSDIIWAKPSPMPESVTDRPTSAHEHLFLLSKGPRYFYDADAIREDVAPSQVGRVRSDPIGGKSWQERQQHSEGSTYRLGPSPFGDGVRDDLGANDGGLAGEALEGAAAKAFSDERFDGGEAPLGVDFVNGADFNGKTNVGAVAREGGSAHTRTVQHGVSNTRGRNKRNVWTVATQPYSEAHFACADEATDCLTAEGWKRYDELRPGMLAAQFHMELQTLSWAPIQNVARYDVIDQEMVVGQRRDMSMVLTPNHRCVIQRRHPCTRQHQAPTIVRADELLPSHTIPTAAPWASSDGDTSLSCEWAELLGWYIAEGYESQQALAVELYQSEDANPAKVARIESLLRQVGAEWTTARARGQVAFRVIGYAALRLRELAPAKRIPPSALLWSQDRIVALLDGLIDGDGHRRPDGRMSFIQKDSERAGMVQALALRLGLSAHLTKRSDGINTVYLTKHHTRSFRGTAGQGAPLGRMRYSGVVWCPRLPAGTWVARRDGKPFITGNTFPPKLIEPCVLAGSPPKCCGVCGAPWRRVVRRETRYEGNSARAGRDLAEISEGGKWGRQERDGHANIKAGPVVDTRTVGWEPTCGHQDDTGRSVVLDPFAGSGTTGVVALRHDRSFIGCELSPAYVEMARRRICDDQPLFNWHSEVAA